MENNAKPLRKGESNKLIYLLRNLKRVVKF